MVSTWVRSHILDRSTLSEAAPFIRFDESLFLLSDLIFFTFYHPLFRFFIYRIISVGHESSYDPSFLVSLPVSLFSWSFALLWSKVNRFIQVLWSLCNF